MNPLRFALFLSPLIVAVILGLFFYNALDDDPSQLVSARIDKSVPQFRLPALIDPERTLTAADVRGPLLLNVWGTWCPSCQIEHPMLNQLAAAGVRLVGLNYKDNPAAARQYLAAHGNPFAFTIVDERGDLGLDLGVYGAPETYFIDANGVIRHRHVGVINGANWEQELAAQWRALATTEVAQ